MSTAVTTDMTRTRREFRRRLAAVCFSVAVLCCGREGRADIRDLLQLLRPVQTTPHTLSQSAPRKLLLNGFPLKVMSGRTPESVDQVLDYYQRSFSREPAGKLPQPLQRQRGTDYGALLTVDAPLVDTMRAMHASRKHYALTAPLRMAYARRADSYTDYLAIWSDEPMAPGVLAPPIDGDAAGMDAPDTPRPPGGLRSFNVYEPAEGYLVVSYYVPSAPQQAIESTIGVLRGAGFAPDPGFANAARAKQRPMVRLERAGQDLIISVSPVKDQPEASTVTYLTRRR